MINIQVLTNLTECKLCFEPFKEPKMLSCCQKNLCFLCMQELWNRKTLPNNQIKCPFCRKYVKLAENGAVGIATNRFVANFVEVIQTMTIKTVTLRICERCAGKNMFMKCDVVCYNCDKYLCQACADEHQNIAYFSKHKLFSITDDCHPQSTTMCHEHIAAFRHVCMDCDKLLCTFCVQDQICAGHNIMEHKSMTSATQQELRSVLTAIVNEDRSNNKISWRSFIFIIMRKLASITGDSEADNKIIEDENGSSQRHASISDSWEIQSRRQCVPGAKLRHHNFHRRTFNQACNTTTMLMDYSAWW